MTIDVVAHGRLSMGRAYAKTHMFKIQLLQGDESEAHLLRGIRDAVEAVFYAEVHALNRAASEAGLATRLKEDGRVFAEEVIAMNEKVRTRKRAKK